MSDKVPLITVSTSFGNKKRFDANVGGVFFSGDTEQEAREKAEQYVRDNGWTTKDERDTAVVAFKQQVVFEARRWEREYHEIPRNCPADEVRLSSQEHQMGLFADIVEAWPANDAALERAQASVAAFQQRVIDRMRECKFPETPMTIVVSEPANDAALTALLQRARLEEARWWLKEVTEMNWDVGTFDKRIAHLEAESAEGERVENHEK